MYNACRGVEAGSAARTLDVSFRHVTPGVEAGSAARTLDVSLRHVTPVAEWRQAALLVL